jgi:hypothetical protein
MLAEYKTMKKARLSCKIFSLLKLPYSKNENWEIAIKIIGYME